MKKLIIFSLVISSLFSISISNIKGFGPNILNTNTIKVKGYEGYGFLEYSGANKKLFSSIKDYLEVNKKIENTCLRKFRKYEGSNYTGRDFQDYYYIRESGSGGEGLKNGDVIRCNLAKEDKNLPFGDSAFIKVKGLKKIPKKIDLKKCSKEIGKAFNQMVYGIDGAGYIEVNFGTRRDSSVKPYTSDIDFSNLDIMKINGHNFDYKRDNGKLKNGDIVTIKIDPDTKECLERETKIISDIVDVKVDSLMKPTQIVYKDPTKKVESPFGIAEENVNLELDKNSQKYKISTKYDDLDWDKSDEEKGYKIENYGFYIANTDVHVYDGYSINYPLYAVIERKSNDGKKDYKIINNLSVCIALDGKKNLLGSSK